MSLAGAMRLALELCERKERKPRTHQWYVERFQLLAREFPENPALYQLTPEAIESFARRRAQTVSWSTVRADLRALGRCFVVAGVPSPLKRVLAFLPDAPPPKIDWFGPTEVRLGLRAIRRWEGDARINSDRDALIIELLLMTGLRLREAADARLEHLQLRRGVLEVPHGKRGPRTVPLHEDARTAFRELLALRGPATPQASLLPLSYSGLLSMMKRWSKRLGEPRLHCHALRHTLGTIMAMSGASEFQIAEMLGHRSLSMARHYARIVGRDARRAIQPITWRKRESHKRSSLGG